ncbi:MAG: hypothetical protein R3F07_00535 [Opitutaceae bacterium]
MTPCQPVQPLKRSGFLKRLVLLAGLTGVPGGLIAAGPELLVTGIRKAQDEANRWAYTQIQVMKDIHGEIIEERIIRVDPSQAFDQRQRLISIDGREPTEKERGKFQKEREKDRLRREREAWKGSKLEDRIRLDEAVVLSRKGKSIVYEVPLVSNDDNPYPAGKFQLWITMDSEREEIREVSLRLREHIRAALVARIDRGELSARFNPVDPTYPAPVTELQVAGAGTILFFRVGVSRDERRTEFKRVTPWDERFSVEFGELEFLGF